MSEPMPAPPSGSLDELEEVTREYASWSRTRFGLAGAAAGAWCVAAFVLALGSVQRGRIAALWTPLVALGLLSLGRRYYQRFGKVLEARPPLPLGGRPIAPWLLVLLLAVATVNVVGRLDAWTGGARGLAHLAVVGALATFPAVALLVERVDARGHVDGAFVLFPVVTMWLSSLDEPFSAQSPGTRLVFVGWLGWLAITGGVMIAVGITEHLGHRRLLRRLAALKGRA